MQKVKCVLLDIEGTICPISFVKDTLFPYALNALPSVLKTKWEDESFKPYRDGFPDEAKFSPEALQAHVEDLTKRDVKIAYHKNLQGYLWEHGYESGAYATPLFADVAPRLRRWKEDGYDLAIYSSGSVFAQKLLFGHVKVAEGGAGTKRTRDEVEDGEDGGGEPASKKREVAKGVKKPQPKNESEDDQPDEEEEDSEAPESGGLETEDLQYLITDWFDTTNAGPKTDAASYTEIAQTKKMSPDQILFLSDNIKEVDAALEAKMVATLVDRPGNAPVSEDDRSRVDVVESLDELDLAEVANDPPPPDSKPEVDEA